MYMYNVHVVIIWCVSIPFHSVDLGDGISIAIGSAQDVSYMYIHVYLLVCGLSPYTTLATYMYIHVYTHTTCMLFDAHYKKFFVCVLPFNAIHTLFYLMTTTILAHSN